MAKKATKQREKKKQSLAEKGKLPLTRLRNRCWKCGRPRGFIRDFGICRICFREMAHEGLIPGVKKSSW
ncbi:MAG: type Z 30S ribosomal protein S14 [Candidatus Caenarcaniphilales bacterium]|nr:type Z 30S ribosomal protein S14 [Candidatus Caenarcaniphilales bacterium]